MIERKRDRDLKKRKRERKYGEREKNREKIGREILEIYNKKW